MQTQYNVSYGPTKPSEIIYAPDRVYTNVNLHQVEREGEEGTEYDWVADSVIVRTYAETAEKQGSELSTATLESCDQDTLMNESIFGTVSDTSKERLCARQIHDGKMTYPTGIPSGVSVLNVYDAYTNHYQFQPALTVSTTLTTAYGAEKDVDTEMYLASTVGFQSSGQVTVTSGEDSIIISYTAIDGNTLTGCEYVSGDEATYPIGATVKQ